MVERNELIYLVFILEVCLVGIFLESHSTNLFNYRTINYLREPLYESHEKHN
jgi:hypothetical protein